MKNANPKLTGDVAALFAEGIDSAKAKRFDAAYESFAAIIALLTSQDSAEGAFDADFLRAYDAIEQVANFLAETPNAPVSVEWLLKAADACEKSAAIRERIIRKSDRPEYQMRGRMLMQLQVNAGRYMMIRSFEKVIEVAQRSAKFQEDFNDEGTVPSFHLIACGNEAMAQLRLGRLKEAADVVNKGLYMWDPENLGDADALKSYAKLCELKCTILAASAKKKLH